MAIQQVSENSILDEVAGGFTFTEALSCAISAAKAYTSGKPLDVASATLACAPVVRDTVGDKAQDVYNAFNMKEGKGDISPVGQVVVRDWVEQEGGLGGYWDDGNMCYFKLN